MTIVNYDKPWTIIRRGAALYRIHDSTYWVFEDYVHINGLLMHWFDERLAGCIQVLCEGGEWRDIGEESSVLPYLERLMFARTPAMGEARDLS